MSSEERRIIAHNKRVLNDKIHDARACGFMNAKDIKAYEDEQVYLLKELENKLKDGYQPDYDIHTGMYV